MSYSIWSDCGYFVSMRVRIKYIINSSILPVENQWNRKTHTSSLFLPYWLIQTSDVSLYWFDIDISNRFVSVPSISYENLSYVLQKVFLKMISVDFIALSDIFIIFTVYYALFLSFLPLRRIKLIKIETNDTAASLIQTSVCSRLLCDTIGRQPVAINFAVGLTEIGLGF